MALGLFMVHADNISNGCCLHMLVLVFMSCVGPGVDCLYFLLVSILHSLLSISSVCASWLCVHAWLYLLSLCSCMCVCIEIHSKPMWVNCFRVVCECVCLCHYPPLAHHVPESFKAPTDSIGVPSPPLPAAPPQWLLLHSSWNGPTYSWTSDPEQHNTT